MVVGKRRGVTILVLGGDSSGFCWWKSWEIVGKDKGDVVAGPLIINSDSGSDREEMRAQEKEARRR